MDVHVIHLVRDPRAVINSVLKKDHWIKSMSPSKVCNNVRDDLRVARQFSTSDLIEQRYTLVR